MDPLPSIDTDLSKSVPSPHNSRDGNKRTKRPQGKPRAKRNRKNRKLLVDPRLRPRDQPAWESPRPVREGGPGGKYAPRKSPSQTNSNDKNFGDASLAAISDAGKNESIEITQLRKQIVEANEMAERFNFALKQSTGAYQELKTKEVSLANQVRKLKQEVNKVRREKADLKLTLSSLEQKAAKQDEQSNTLRVERDNLLKHIHDHDMIITRNKDQMRGLKSRIRESEKKIVEERFQKLEMETKYQHASKKLASIRKVEAQKRKTLEAEISEKLDDAVADSTMASHKVKKLAKEMETKDEMIKKMQEALEKQRLQIIEVEEDAEKRVVSAEEFVKEREQHYMKENKTLMESNQKLWHQIQALGDSLADSNEYGDAAQRQALILENRLNIAKNMKNNASRIQDLNIALAFSRRENSALQGRLEVAEEKMKAMSINMIAMSRSLELRTASGTMKATTTVKKSPKHKRSGKNKPDSRIENMQRVIKRLRKTVAEYETLIHNRDQTLKDAIKQRDAALKEVSAAHKAMHARLDFKRTKGSAGSSPRQKIMSPRDKKSALLVAREGITSITKRLDELESRQEKLKLENVGLKKKVIRYIAKMHVLQGLTEKDISQIRAKKVMTELEKKELPPPPQKMEPMKVEKEIEDENPPSTVAIPQKKKDHQGAYLRRGLKVGNRYLMVAVYEIEEPAPGLRFEATDSLSCEPFEIPMVGIQYVHFLLLQDGKNNLVKKENKEKMINYLLGRLQLHMSEGELTLMLDSPHLDDEKEGSPASPEAITDANGLKRTVLPKNEDSSRFIESSKRQEVQKEKNKTKRRLSGLGLGAVSLNTQISELDDTTEENTKANGKRRKSVMNPSFDVRKSPEMKNRSIQEKPTPAVTQTTIKKKQDRAFMMKITRQDTFGQLKVSGPSKGQQNPLLLAKLNKAKKQKIKDHSKKKKRMTLRVQTNGASENAKKNLDKSVAHEEMASLIGTGTTEQELDKIRNEEQKKKALMAHKAPSPFSKPAANGAAVSPAFQRQDTLGAIQNVLRKPQLKDQTNVTASSPLAKSKSTAEEATNTQDEETVKEETKTVEPRGKVEQEREEQEEQEEQEEKEERFRIGSLTGGEGADDMNMFLTSDVSMFAGDDAFGDGEEVDEEEEAQAATKIQAIFRGKQDRAQVEEKKKRTQVQERRRSITAEIENANFDGASQSVVVASKEEKEALGSGEEIAVINSHKPGASLGRQDSLSDLMSATRELLFNAIDEEVVSEATANSVKVIVRNVKTPENTAFFSVKTSSADGQEETALDVNDEVISQLVGDKVDLLGIVKAVEKWEELKQCIADNVTVTSTTPSEIRWKDSAKYAIFKILARKPILVHQLKATDLNIPDIELNVYKQLNKFGVCILGETQTEKMFLEITEDMLIKNLETNSENSLQNMRKDSAAFIDSIKNLLSHVEVIKNDQGCSLVYKE
eukprot:g2336.t1